MESSLDLEGNKNMNLIERLIKEVAKTPLLWNRYHNDYNNRAAMDYEWERIASILNKDKDFVKQKWRNLRDQFQRESKKVKVPFDNPTKPYIQYYRGKWIYFECMLFLREIASKLNNSCYSPSQEIEIHDGDIIKEELIVFDDSDDMFGEHANNMYNNGSDDYEGESADVPTAEDDVNYQLLIQPKVEVIEDEQSDEVGNKRKVLLTDSQPTPAKIKKSSAVDASSNTEFNEIDDDLHFVKSLVPFLRKLSPLRKLLVRNEIQNLLIRESLCENCKFVKNSCHNS